MKSVPENDQLSKTCLTRLPGAQTASVHTGLSRSVDSWQLQQHRAGGGGAASCQRWAGTERAGAAPTGDQVHAHRKPKCFLESQADCT